MVYIDCCMLFVRAFMLLCSRRSVQSFDNSDTVRQIDTHRDQVHNHTKTNPLNAIQCYNRTKPAQCHSTTYTRVERDRNEHTSQRSTARHDGKVR